MGSLLEALWGYFMNQELVRLDGGAAECEIGWLSDHEYNDFACIERDVDWAPATRAGELLRIEVKSMNIEVDEAKGHFDQLCSSISIYELLLVLIWKWEPLDKHRVYPRVIGHFLDRALPIALIRDRLHDARGGAFVDKDSCPDHCDAHDCPHDGEPLNASGKRERLSGPVSTRPSASVAYAANYGGLVRMLKTNSEQERDIFRAVERADPIAAKFIDFIHRNFPREELNHYSMAEWRRVAGSANVNLAGKSKAELAQSIREEYPEYRNLLRDTE